jgi:hypothetical protein
VIPTRKDQPRQPNFDREAYRLRNRVERLINRLKQARRIATRYEKRGENYLAMIHIGMILLWMKPFADTAYSYSCNLASRFLPPVTGSVCMSSVSIETTLELWTASLRDVKARMRPLFRQERVAASASFFLEGLLGSEPRKTGWMRAEAAGDPGPWRQQAILGRGHWDADVLRDVVREYALETLADPDAVLV